MGCCAGSVHGPRSGDVPEPHGTCTADAMQLSAVPQRLLIAALFRRVSDFGILHAQIKSLVKTTNPAQSQGATANTSAQLRL